MFKFRGLVLGIVVTLVPLMGNALVSVRTGDRTNCFPPKLNRLLQQISTHFRRPVVILSGYRSPKANRRRGGAEHSLHMRCLAADFQVPGISANKVARYATTLPGRGGVGFYCNQRVHLDVGRARQWGPCLR